MATTTYRGDARVVKSRVAWGAIFAGTLVATALFLVLGSLWAAIDLTMTWRIADTAPIGVAVLSLLAMFAGGWTTSRLAAGESTGEALFFGIVLWSVTALLLLYLAINGILVLGSSTLLGQAGGGTDTAVPVSTVAAWWGFFGVVLSLVATLAGVLAGIPRRSLRAARDVEPRRAAPPRQPLEAPPLAP